MSTDYSYFFSTPLHLKDLTLRAEGLDLLVFLIGGKSRRSMVQRPEMHGASANAAWCVFLKTLVLKREEQGLIAGRARSYRLKDLTLSPEGLDLRA